MKTKTASSIVRRSVALPQELVEEVQAVAPADLRHNLNRLVIVALQELPPGRKRGRLKRQWRRWRLIPRCSV